VATANTILVIGASAGGVTALQHLIARLEPHWPLSVFVTLHTGKNRSLMPQILSWNTSLPVQFAEDGAAFTTGVYVAPPDRHLLVEATTMALSAGPRENYARPAIDPMFRSAAQHHGSRVIAVLLTGYLNDGMNGLYEVHARGGCTIVQDPRDAQVPEIPLNALRRLSPDYVLPLAQIPDAIDERLKEAADSSVRRRR
jgi:two-component system chemotaxis response regulator CheB